MIPDLQASLVCEDVRLEASGAHSLIGVINGISAPAIPVRILKLCVWSRWCSGSGHFIQLTRLVGPDEETIIGSCITQFTLESEDSHVINVNLFAGMEFTKEGIYHVEILLDNELKLRYPLQVILVKPGPPVPGMPQN